MTDGEVESLVREVFLAELGYNLDTGVEDSAFVAGLRSPVRVVKLA